MNSSPDQPHPSADAGDPYALLGISPEASFEEVQAAKQARSAELPDDPLARARIEAAYDAVLMGRLKQRQQGKVSTAARTASVREDKAANVKASPALPGLPALPKLPVKSLPQLSLPTLALDQGTDRWITLTGAGVLVGLLLLLPAASSELLLALGTLGAVAMLQRRNRRFWPAVLWAFGLLVVGLVLGGVLMGVLPPALPLGLPLNPAQVQSLPALLLLALGALLIA